MRTVSLLFSVYLFYLAVWPCTDQEMCQDEVRTGIELSQADTHQHGENEQDFCSPFCICQCCSTHAQQPAYFNLSTISPIFAENVNTYVPKKIQALPHTFWQPPKLG